MLFFCGAFGTAASVAADPPPNETFDQLVNRLKTTMGMTNVVVTHVMESVERIADHVVMLDAGRVLLDGTLRDLDSSADPRVKQFRTGDFAGPIGGATSRELYHKDLLM